MSPKHQKNPTITKSPEVWQPVHLVWNSFSVISYTHFWPIWTSEGSSKDSWPILTQFSNFKEAFLCLKSHSSLLWSFLSNKAHHSFSLANSQKTITQGRKQGTLLKFVSNYTKIETVQTNKFQQLFIDLAGFEHVWKLWCLQLESFQSDMSQEILVGCMNNLS